MCVLGGGGCFELGWRGVFHPKPKGRSKKVYTLSIRNQICTIASAGRISTHIHINTHRQIQRTDGRRFLTLPLFSSNYNQSSLHQMSMLLLSSLRTYFQRQIHLGFPKHGSPPTETVSHSRFMWKNQSEEALRATKRLISRTPPKSRKKRLKATKHTK